MNTKRNYKDTVYRMLFKEPRYALSLYNSLNGTTYTDESILEFNTLENAIYMGIKNDLSFLIMNQMYLYEQQSTYAPNIPLRNLFYVADLLQAYVKDESLYSSKRIKLPAPHFVVLYNGTEKLQEKIELKLSDSFERNLGEPELELKVQILNINPGMNEELKERCPILKEYMLYVEKIREYVKSMPLEEAVEQAIEGCVRDNILRDFLLEQRAEVFKMSIYEYDEERELKLIRADERELGRQEERANTQREWERAENEKENSIKSVISLCKEFGGDQETAISKLIEKCKMTQEDAKEKVRRYWDM